MLFVTEAEALAGYQILIRKGRIGVTAEGGDEAEKGLRSKAARLGANAVTEVAAETQRKKYQAGVGPKGNPFFRTREVTDWTAWAVAVAPAPRRAWPARLFGARPMVRRAVVDGSNVLHAARQGPVLGSVRAVVGKLRDEGWTPQLFFDANVGYKAMGRHVSEQELTRALLLSAKQVRIVPSGQPADPFVMDYACQTGAIIVTNDLYWDNFEMMRGLARLGVNFEGAEVRLL